MIRTCDVAIVGGGIGGLTLAIGLAQGSLSVQVYEQHTELREIGAGIALGGNATHLLEKLGVDPIPVANVPPTLEFRRWNDGQLLWSHPIGEWYRQEVGAPFVTLHRSTLQHLLAAAVPSESIHLNRRLIGLFEEPGGVRLQFERGDEVFAALVVGADGVNSTVRRYICGNVRPVYSGEIGFRGVIPTEKSPDLPTPTSLHIWCGPGTHAVFYGMDRGELVNLLAVYEPDQLPEWTRSSSRATATREGALRIFENYFWDDRILDLVRHIEGDTNFWALVDLPRLPRWSRGRILILGDPLTHHFRIRDKAPARRSKMHTRLVHCSAIVVSTITARRSSLSSGSGDIARRGFKRIHGLRVGRTSSPATVQPDETRVGRRFRNESDGFINIARRRRSSYDLLDCPGHL